LLVAFAPIPQKSIARFIDPDQRRHFMLRRNRETPLASGWQICGMLKMCR
jgi:hypothetical protein